MSNPAFFQKISITTSTFASATTPDVKVPFAGCGISMLNEDSTNIVEVSFDGINVHDELNPALMSKSALYNNRVVPVIWFRLKTGSSAVVSVRIW